MALAQLLAGVAGEEKVGRPSWIKAGADAVRPAGRGVNAEAVDLVVCMRKQTGRGCLARPAATAQQGTLGLCAPRLGGVNAQIVQPMRPQGTGKAPSPRESAGGRFGKKTSHMLRTAERVQLPRPRQSRIDLDQPNAVGNQMPPPVCAYKRLFAGVVMLGRRTRGAVC
jgi:hypothetical protein